MRLFLLTGCIALAAGCAHSPAPQPAPVGMAPSPPATLIPDNEPIRVTAADLGGDLGGAAYQVRGYRDVLRRDREGAFGGPALDISALPYEAMSKQLDQHALTGDESELGHASVPVNTAWQRYCNAGVGMTDDDWQYVEAHDAFKGVPERIADDCNYPK